MSKFIAQLIKLNTFIAKVYHFFLMRTYQGMPALNYLHRRGINNSMINSYCLGFAPRKAILYRIVERHGFSKSVMQASGLFTHSRFHYGKLTDRFYDRIMIPIAGKNRFVIGFSGRTLTHSGHTAKYLDIPENQLFQGRQVMFNLAHAENNIAKHGLILCEGFMDVISMQQSGVKNTLASLGAHLTQTQINNIKSLTNNVTVCYDGDAAGQNGIDKAIDQLQNNGLNVKAIVLPNGLDPDDYRRKYGEANLKKYVQTHAEAGVYFKLGRAWQKDRQFAIDSTRILSFLDDAENIISKLNNKLLESMYAKQVALRLNISPEAVIDETLAKTED